MTYQLWIDDDIQFVKENYQQLTDLELAIRLKTNSRRIKSKRLSLRLTRHDYQRWTMEEAVFIQENCKSTSDVELARRLKTTRERVGKKRLSLGVARRRLQRWTTEEVQFVKDNHHSMTDKKISLHIPRSPSAINFKRNELGFSYRKPWSPLEIQYLKKYWRQKDAIIANQLGRTEFSVRGRRKKLGLKKQEHRPWSSDEDMYLITNWRKMTDTDLALHLGRTVNAIGEKRNHLQLSRLNDRDWTVEEKSYLQSHYRQKSVLIIAKYLHRSPRDVYLERNKLIKCLPWSEEERIYLQCHQTTPPRNLVKRLKKTSMDIQQQIKLLGSDSSCLFNQKLSLYEGEQVTRKETFLNALKSANRFFLPTIDPEIQTKVQTQASQLASWLIATVWFSRAKSFGSLTLAILFQVHSQVTGHSHYPFISDTPCSRSAVYTRRSSLRKILSQFPSNHTITRQ